MEREQLFNESLEIVKESMKSVKQEVLIRLPDGSDHIAYVHDCTVNPDGSFNLDFSTFDQDRKTEVGDALIDCIKLQLKELEKQALKMFSFK